MAVPRNVSVGYPYLRRVALLVVMFSMVAALRGQAPVLPLAGKVHEWNSAGVDSVGGRNAVQHPSAFYEYDGIDDYASVPGSFGGVAEYTLEAQFYPEYSFEFSVQSVVAPTDARFIHLNVSNDPAEQVQVFTDAGTISLPAIPRSARHVVLAARSGSVSLYVNGALAGTSTAAFSQITATSSLRFGSGLGGGRFFDGRIPRVAAYSRAITAAEAAALYADFSNPDDRPYPITLPARVPDENDGTISFTITRAYAGAAETIRYTVTGTAAGIVSPASGQLTFAAGEASQPLVLNLADNSRADFARSFEFKLENVAGGLRAGQVASWTIPIRDDEGAEDLTGGVDFALSSNGRYVASVAAGSSLAGHTEISLIDRTERTIQTITYPVPVPPDPDPPFQFRPPADAGSQSAAAAPAPEPYPKIPDGNVVFTSTDSVDGPSAHPSVSADGRHVVFESKASVLVDSDPNGTLRDVFLFDREAGSITRLIDVPEGREAWAPTITPDGRYVLFATDHSFSASDTNGSTTVIYGFDGEAYTSGPVADAYVFDRNTSTCTCVSLRSSGTTSSSPATPLAISDDGKIILFASAAGDLVPGDTNGVSDLFIRDLNNNTTTRVSVTSAGGQADGPTTRGTLSGNGQVVTFVSAASNLVAGDTNGLEDAFLRDLAAGTTVRLDAGDRQSPTFPVPVVPALNFDGSRVLYTARRGTVGGYADIDLVLWDRAANGRTLLNVLPDGQRASFLGSKVALSADASLVFWFGYTAFDQPLGLVPGGLFPARDGNRLWVLAPARGPSGIPSIEALAPAVAENAGVARFRISRGFGYRAGLSVSYQLEGTAVAGADYLGTGGTVSFAQGQTEQILEIPLVNDAVAEAAETLSVRLTGSSEGLLGENPLATTVIADDDAAPTVTLVDEEIAVGESDGVATVKVRRNGGLGQPLSVFLSTQAQTALSGSDYVGFAGRVVSFAAGEAEVSTAISLVDDLTVEGDETFLVVLSASGVGLGVTQATVTILDSAASSTDRVGHRLRIVDLPFRTYTAGGTVTLPVTVENPGPGASFAGDVQFVGVADRWAGNNTLPAGGVLATASLGSLASGGRQTVSGTVTLPSLFPGIDYYVYAIVRENLGGTLVEQMAIPIALELGPDYPDAPRRDRIGATGGIPEVSSGVSAPAFAVNPPQPATLVSIRIVNGRTDLLATESVKFSVAGTLSDGTDAGSLGATWTASAFTISSGGVLKTTLIPAARTVTITAKVVSGGVTRTAQQTVSVAFLAPPSFDPPAELALAVGRSFSLNLTAAPLVSGFVVSTGALPPGIALSPAGRLSGTAFGPGDYVAAIRASNPAGDAERTIAFRVRQPISEGTEGRYLGIAANSSAVIDVSITPRGAFTAKVRSQKTNTSFRGLLTANVGSVSRRRGLDGFELGILPPDSTDVLPRLSGRAWFAGNEFPFTLYRAVTSYPLSGVLTFSADSSVYHPALGDGYGSVQVAANGMVRLKAATGAGLAYSQGTAITEDLGLPLFGSFDARRGFVAAQVRIDPATGRLSASLHEERQPGGKGSRAGGFAFDSALAGGFLAAPPAGDFALYLTASETIVPFSLNASGKIVGRIPGFAFRFNAKTGLVTGNARDGTGRRAFAGAWLPETGEIRGYYKADRDLFRALLVE